MPGDRGRKYQSFDGSRKSKSQINSEYYFNHYKKMDWKKEYQFKEIIEEEDFFNTTRVCPKKPI